METQGQALKGEPGMESGVRGLEIRWDPSSIKTVLPGQSLSPFLLGVATWGLLRGSQAPRRAVCGTRGSLRLPEF